MPYGNPGYDFVCGRGFKIDVKSSCLRQHDKNHRYQRWAFPINQNNVADYFLLLGFDNRDNLKPLHVWLVPGDSINAKSSLSITNSCRSIARYAQYERPIDKVVLCCDQLREEVKTCAPN
ncbi:hypothetical protein M0R72_05755 [Candidatus Pacearchaeota archaeon]|nr:hypothetical protein [Candidatus Pacearchaeota archaeon]